MEKELDGLNEFIEEVKDITPNDDILDVDKEENKDLKGDNIAWRILEQKDKKTDISLKWLYGLFIVLVLGFWEWFVVYFSIQQLNPCDKCIHKVSDVVFVTLLTTATANILVLPAIVLNYLFPKSKEK